MFERTRNAWRRLAASYGYDATEDRGRRRPVRTATYSEDDHANDRKRRILTANSRDLSRNFAVAAWAIRKHLDFTSSFTFQAKTDDDGFNRELEAWIAASTRPRRFDLAGRHGMQRAVRLAEQCRIRDGDVFWLKNGGDGFARGHIQAIEGDRVCTPRDTAVDTKHVVNGVRVNENGESLAYLVSRRDGSRLTFDREVPASSVLHHASFDRFDQVRGVSPIASALNWFQDTYEGFEYTLAKIKVAQLFGLSVFRDGSDSLMGANTAVPATDADGDGVAESGYAVNFGRGPFVLDLDPGDRAEVLESHTPSSETLDFLKLMIHVALKALDIPYSFFDESFTNFYGSRGGLIQYQKSCETKIRDIQELQDDWAMWRLGLAVFDGEIVLPRGKRFDWLDWEFVPVGVPWWDPVKEVRGQTMAVAAGFTSPQRVCRETGTDYENNIREIAEAQRFAAANGVAVTYSKQPPADPQPTTVEIGERFVEKRGRRK